MEHRKLHMEIWKGHSFVESNVCLLCRLKVNENNYTVKKSLSSAPKGAKDTATNLGMSGENEFFYVSVKHQWKQLWGLLCGHYTSYK